MNDLNSVLLEGIVVGELSTGDDACSFQVESKRTDANGICTCIGVTIVTRGRLAQVCGEYLKAGLGVRVVGRLAYYMNAGLHVAAEHVEFKSKDYG